MRQLETVMVYVETVMVHVPLMVYEPRMDLARYGWEEGAVRRES